MQTVRNFCPALTKVWMFQQILVKILTMNFHENPSGGNCIVPCRQI
jgi:hypothetical protein